MLCRNSLAVCVVVALTSFRLVQASSPWQNPVDPLDVNGDGIVFADDALNVANGINGGLFGELPAVANTPPYLDVSGDEPTALLTPLDFFIVANTLKLNAPSRPDSFVKSSQGLAGIDVFVTDLNGDPVTTANVGDTLVVTAVVADESAEVGGMFGAYFDLRFDAAIASPLGQVDFGQLFPNGRVSGEVADGVISKLGAFANFLPGTDPFPQPIVSAAFRADAVGEVTFAVDDVNAFAMVRGIDQPVLTRVGTASVRVVPEPAGMVLESMAVVGFAALRGRVGRFAGARGSVNG